jgi:hypothetical protein
MKHAIDVAYAEGATVTYFAKSKDAADDFVERIMESGPQALSAIVRTVTDSEAVSLDDPEPVSIDSQNDQVLAYLKRNGSITSWEAMQELACMRLASRIYDLKCRGYKIESSMTKNSNGKRYAIYRYKGE